MKNQTKKGTNNDMKKDISITATRRRIPYSTSEVELSSTVTQGSGESAREVIQRRRPITCLLEPNGLALNAWGRRPAANEPFKILDNRPIEIPCHIEDRYNKQGEYVGEDGYVMDSDLWRTTDYNEKTVALYPWHSAYTSNCIFPVVLERRCSQQTKLHQSLDEALVAARTDWITLRYNSEESCYEWNVASAGVGVFPTYFGFEWDCAALMVDPYCEPHPDHPLMALLRRQQAVCEGTLLE